MNETALAGKAYEHGCGPSERSGEANDLPRTVRRAVAGLYKLCAYEVCADIDS